MNAAYLSALSTLAGSVIGGGRVGLLLVEERWFTIYFARLPIAHFDSREWRVVPWRKTRGFDRDEAGEEEASPSPAPHPFGNQEKVSGMCPV